jgi:hypothetical protein
MVEEKRKQIEELLRTKFKENIEVHWRGGFNGNQIIRLDNIGAGYADLWCMEIELDKVIFFESSVIANVELILLHVKRHILDIFLYN